MNFIVCKIRLAQLLITVDQRSEILIMNKKEWEQDFLFSEGNFLTARQIDIDLRKNLGLQEYINS